VFRKTVESVTAALARVVTDLEVVAEYERGLALGKEEDVEILRTEIAGHHSDADQAERIKERLEALLQ
jgi:hypothetical protein